jgi:hypothetical protein
MEKEFQCDVCNKIYKTKHTLTTHKNKFHKDVDVVAKSEESSSLPKEENNNIKLEITENNEEESDDESSCYSSCYESADEDGKWTCVFCKKRFDRKDFKNYHEIVCLTHVREILFHKPTSISVLDMLRITDKDFP